MERKTIVDVIDFENANPALLFKLYTNAALHAKVTGAPATITDKLGDAFNLYGGFCFGENIEISKDKLMGGSVEVRPILAFDI